jgi:hypothetical protein
MNKKFILPTILGAGIILASAFTVVNSSGIAYYTGSPSDGGNCSSCHSGGATTPTASITASPAFGGSGTSLTYVPGTTYTLSVIESGYSYYGFDIEIMNSNSASATTDAGTMTALNTTYCKNNGTGPTNVTHKKVIPVATNATIKWVAPASGTAYLYASVLGVNDNGSTSGDKVKSLAYVLTPATTTGLAVHQANEANLGVYPNPATDNIRITYTLRERGNVSIKLYNLNGEVVSELVNGMQDAGIQNNDARIPSGLAKGLYMVRLNVNGQLSTQKLMVY